MNRLLFIYFLLLVLPMSAHRPVKQNSLLYSEMVPATYRTAFCESVVKMAARLHVEPDWLMIVMRFESANTYRPNVRNKYSGAVGLIQFIPTTAYRLGTTPKKLAAMTAVDQLVYVEKYFQPYAGRMTDVYDVYIVVFAPAFLGRKPGTILYSSYAPDALGKRRYRYNKVLDVNRNGVITIRDVRRQIRTLVP